MECYGNRFDLLLIAIDVLLHFLSRLVWQSYQEHNVDEDEVDVPDLILH